MHTKILRHDLSKIVTPEVQSIYIKMGCDGGTIPKRDELVRTKKKPEQVNC